MLNQKYTAFPHTQHRHMELLLTCYTICSACAAMCIDEGRAETAKLCEDCADVCALTIKLHSKDSPYNEKLMDLCGEVCARCAVSCSKVKTDHCQQCSSVCQECAQACQS